LRHWAHSDASQMAMYCKAIAAAETLAMYDMAVMTFQQLGDFRDSKQMVTYYTARGNEAAADAVDLDIETTSITALNLAISKYEQAEEGDGSFTMTTTVRRIMISLRKN